jgi:hypothetical protein
VLCSLCKKEIPTGTLTYALRLDLFAAAEDLEITGSDLSGDTGAELKRLIDKLEDLNDDETEEETDRVFERHAFRLCSDCRDELHKILKMTRI